jgi:hypothetical protein
MPDQPGFDPARISLHVELQSEQVRTLSESLGGLHAV